MNKQLLRRIITQQCKAMKLDEAIADECILLVSDVDKIQGLPMERLSIALIKIVCMNNNIIMSNSNELLKSMNCSMHDVHVTMKVLRRKYGIRENYRDMGKTVMSIAEYFGFSPEMKNDALELANEVANSARLSSHNTMVLAGSIGYVIALVHGRFKKLTQYDFAKYVGVTDVSIRNNYRQVARLLYDGFEKEEVDDVSNTEGIVTTA